MAKRIEPRSVRVEDDNGRPIVWRTFRDWDEARAWQRQWHADQLQAIRESAGKRAQVLREAQGWTQEDLARRARVSAHSVWLYEHGRKVSDTEFSRLSRLVERIDA